MDTATTIAPAYTFLAETLLVIDGRGVRSIAPAAGEFAEVTGTDASSAAVKVSGDGLDEQLRQAGLQDCADVLKRYHSPAVRLVTRPLADGWSDPGKGPALGTTRFGGWPDLPADSRWPRWAGRPMAFLAQINLADAHQSNPQLRLPSAGLLSFFLGCADETYDKDNDSRKRYMVDLMLGTEAEQRGGWRVLFTPGLSNLRRLRYDTEPLPELFTPCVCECVSGNRSLPDEDAVVYPHLGLSADQRDRYAELLAQTRADEDGENTYHSQLLGYPNLLQFSPPETFCARASAGMNPYEIDDADETISAAAREWCLLLQLSSDGNADFSLGRRRASVFLRQTRQDRSRRF